MLTIQYWRGEEIKEFTWMFDSTKRIPKLQRVDRLLLTGIEFRAANDRFCFTTTDDFASEWHRDNVYSVWPSEIKQYGQTRLEFTGEAASNLLNELADWWLDLFYENKARNEPDHRKFEQVGIFWDRGETWMSDRVYIADAEQNGDRMSHGDHAAFWDKMVAEFNDGKPYDIEYDDWPRGRVVYDKLTDKFVIFADRKLLNHYDVWRIANLFGLAMERVSAHPTSHYVRGDDKKLATAKRES